MRSSKNNTGTRVPELDGIRGVAILLVVFFHYGSESLYRASGALPHAIGSASILSWSGVDLFFVLSGFLIGGILLDQRDSGNYFRTFYVRRVCRIVPAYFIWLGLFFVIPVFLSAAQPQWTAKIFQQAIPKLPKWGYFLFLQNFYIAKSGLFGSPWLGVTWSLTVEEQFYLLLPLAIRFFLPRKPFAVLIFLIVLVPLFRTFLFLFHPEVFVFVLLPCRADALLLGVLCACIVRDEGWRQRIERNRGWLYFAFAVLAFGMVCLTVFATKIPEQSLFNSFEMSTFGFSWIALFYACFLLIVLTGRTSALAGMMRARLLRHFGMIAYGIYLIHMAVNSLAHGLISGTEPLEITSFGGAAVTLLAFFGTWLLAVLSWNLLEKPIIRWGHSFVYESRREVAQEPVASETVVS